MRGKAQRKIAYGYPIRPKRIHSNSIESKIYNGIPSDFVNPKFKTVAEMKSFLENYLPSLI